VELDEPLELGMVVFHKLMQHSRFLGVGLRLSIEKKKDKVVP
jgi:hypothetical protein